MDCACVLRVLLLFLKRRRHPSKPALVHVVWFFKNQRAIQGALLPEDVDGATGRVGGTATAGGAAATRPPTAREVLREPDPETLVAAHFGSVRAGFNRDEFGASGSGDPRLQEVWLPGVLNLGVRPRVAIERARRRFEERGGVVLERTAANGVEIFDDGARVAIAEPPRDGAADGAPRERGVTARLVVDAMGNAR